MIINDKNNRKRNNIKNIVSDAHTDKAAIYLQKAKLNCKAGEVLKW